MNEWKTRTTRLVRDSVKVSVMSFMIEAAKRWRTCFMVHADDNPMVSYEGLFWSDAKECHDNIVHSMELMGYRVFSDELNAKKKRPMRRQPHRAQKITELP